MKFAVCLAFFLLGLAMVLANDSAATATVVGATATGLVASPGTDVTKTITVTSTKTVEQNTNVRLKTPSVVLENVTLPNSPHLSWNS